MNFRNLRLSGTFQNTRKAMGFLKEKPWYAAANSQRVTTLCFVIIALIAVADAVLLPPVGLGLLYLIPLAMAAAFVSRWQLLFLVAICTVFWEAFSNLPDGPSRVVRVVFVLLSYAFVMLLINGSAVYRRAAVRRLDEFEEQITALHGSQQRLEVLLNAAPVAIFTVGSDSTIDECNRAAHELFGVGLGGLRGQPVGAFVPEFERLRADTVAVKVKSSLRQSDGAAFDAEVRIVRNGPDGHTVVVAERVGV